VIAHRSACGTHYKHEILATPARGRCGRCDATIDLSRLRPYRIVPLSAPLPADTERAAAHLPIGLDDPALATVIARNVQRDEPPAAEPAAPGTGVEMTPAPPRWMPTESESAWNEDDPLPPIPEMTGMATFGGSMPPTTEADIVEGVPDSDDAALRVQTAVGRDEGRGTTWALWLAAGAIAGTGLSWSMGGTTLPGISAGALFGALAGWGWLRWISPR
jgi:hypothetical protein